MTWEGWLTLGIVALAFLSLVRNWGPPDAILLGACLFLGLTGIIRPEEIFAGFVKPGLLTVAGLFVVAAALRETGALDRMAARLFGGARDEKSVLVRMGAWVVPLSAFMNNTPVVAMLVPVVTTWCRRNRVSPSRLLIPLSYLTILGGTCTLIGTSTNLVVNDLMSQAAPTHGSLKPMGLFELTWLGLPYAVVGGLYIRFIAPRLLPNRMDLIEELGAKSREYLVNMRVEPGCRLIGQSIEGAGLRHLPGLFLIEITRNEHMIAPVEPTEIIREGDVLTFTGVVSLIVDLERIEGLVPVADENYERRAAERRDKTLCEAVVSPMSPLIGKTIRDADFRALYNAAVIAVHRGGARLKGRVGDIVLRQGDTLLLQTGPHFARAHRNNADFILVSGIEEARPARHERATLSLVLMGGLILLMATEVLSTELAAFLVAGLMVATRCISVTLARQSIDWQTLITIGASYGVGTALERSGAAEALGGWFVGAAGGLGPYVALALVYVFVNVVTEMITNNAAAVLTFPFVLVIADQLGVDPRPFVMIIAFAASASFCTPIGYQTNLMVYGPGGYKFTDFTRTGIPLTLMLMLLATSLAPIIWPF